MNDEARDRETRLAMEYRRLDFLIRSVTTSLLAVLIVGAAVYEAVADSEVHGWIAAAAGIVVGVYFGAHVATNGKSLPRLARRSDHER